MSVLENFWVETVFQKLWPLLYKRAELELRSTIFIISHKKRHFEGKFGFQQEKKFVIFYKNLEKRNFCLPNILP